MSVLLAFWPLGIDEFPPLHSNGGWGWEEVMDVSEKLLEREKGAYNTFSEWNNLLQW